MRSGLRQNFAANLEIRGNPGFVMNCDAKSQIMVKCKESFENECLIHACSTQTVHAAQRFCHIVTFECVVRAVQYRLDSSGLQEAYGKGSWRSDARSKLNSTDVFSVVLQLGSDSTSELFMTDLHPRLWSRVVTGHQLFGTRSVAICAHACSRVVRVCAHALFCNRPNLLVTILVETRSNQCWSVLYYNF